MRFRRAFGLVGVVAAACVPAVPVAPVAPEPAPIAEPLAPPLVFAPIAPATSFGDPAPAHASDPAIDALFAAVFEAERGYGVVVRDPRLDIACDELAGVVQRGGTLSHGLVEFALEAHGVIEPAASFVVVPGVTVDDLKGQLGTALDHGNVRLGLGGAPLIAVVVYTPPVMLAPIPRRVAAGASFELSGVLDATHRGAQITVTHDTGVRDHPPVAAGDAGEFRATIACGPRPGRQWVEVEAESDTGPLVLVPIYCGEPVPATFALEPDANLRTADAARRLTSIINRERSAAQLPPIRTEPRATAAAQRYATAMRRAASAAHDLDGQPSDRLRAAGLVPPLLLESTMQVDSLGRAAELLLNDPLYRADLASPRVSHLGVGIATDEHGELFIAIDYVNIPAPVDTAALIDRVRDLIRASQTCCRRVLINPELSRAAQRYATGLSNGRPDVEMWHDAIADLKGLDRRYTMWNRTTTQLIAADHLAGAELVAGKEVDAIGIGVVQSPRTSLRAGTVWIVVIFAQK